jgi:hypothetical protein
MERMMKAQEVILSSYNPEGLRFRPPIYSIPLSFRRKGRFLFGVCNGLFYGIFLVNSLLKWP